MIGGKPHGVAHVAPPSVDKRNTYLVIGEPPSLAGGVQFRVTEVAVAFEPTTPVGAPAGTAPGRVLIAGEGADQAEPQPTAVTAMTSKR